MDMQNPGSYIRWLGSRHTERIIRSGEGPNAEGDVLYPTCPVTRLISVDNNGKPAGRVLL